MQGSAREVANGCAAAVAVFLLVVLSAALVGLALGLGVSAFHWVVG